MFVLHRGHQVSSNTALSHNSLFKIDHSAAQYPLLWVMHVWGRATFTSSQTKWLYSGGCWVWLLYYMYAVCTGGVNVCHYEMNGDLHLVIDYPWRLTSHDHSLRYHCVWVTSYSCCMYTCMIHGQSMCNAWSWNEMIGDLTMLQVSYLS